jgi:hypothetical protein
MAVAMLEVACEELVWVQIVSGGCPVAEYR